LHGLSKDAWKRYSAAGFQPYDVTAPGYKFNMTDIQAAMGIHQLDRLESNLKIREKYWEIYTEAFRDLEGISLLPITYPDPQTKGTRHARHLYSILLNLEELSLSRWDFVNAMKAENIGTGIHFIALHLTTYYQERFGYQRGDFPVAENISDRTISLPLSPGMSETDVEDVIRAVKKVVTHSLK
jgi:dTDP-4-amino-4,6-dideoxygalactose transaminase